MTECWPRLVVNAKAIEENARRVVQKCSAAGIYVSGVTKGMCAHPDIVRAMVAGGCSELADSRVGNLAALKAMNTGLPLLLLRIPMLSELPLVVSRADCSLVSTAETVDGLEKACAASGLVHEVIIMVDLGDLREGVWMDDTGRIAEALTRSRRVRCRGVGVNFGCYGGTLPTREKLLQLTDIGKELERELGCHLSVFSGGSTSSLLLLERGEIPPGINNLRIGEGILLGEDVTSMRSIPWLIRRTMWLEAELVEVRKKPSVPVGPVGADAFGGRPVFEDRGPRTRAIAAVGRQDVRVEGLVPELEGVSILGASSDHLILDVEDSASSLAQGDKLKFFPDYGAMLALATSPYVPFEVV
ncbi:MAG TPA: alanine/ornithine racemase family PLP-dependent enzyme [Aminivibrio sp.]|nr:alanine/ornithine racemase family PLP-dependent enzyme [Aminivibrio sp.]